MFFKNKLCMFFSSISLNFMAPRALGAAGAAIFLPAFEGAVGRWRPHDFGFLKIGSFLLDNFFFVQLNE
jgi:hypothetical protein